VAVAGAVVNSALFNVDGGHRAVIFDRYKLSNSSSRNKCINLITRFVGVKREVVGEGTHFMIPWVQRPIIYDIRARSVWIVTQ
jgi:prohibitin 1